MTRLFLISVCSVLLFATSFQSVNAQQGVSGASLKTDRMLAGDVQTNIDLKLIDRVALHEALNSLTAHGLSPTFYQSQLEAMGDASHPNFTYFIADLLADLAYGATRENQHTSQQQALIQQLVACEPENYVQCLQQMAARHPNYAPIQLTLDHYRNIQAQGGWPTLAGGGMIHPGEQDARIPELRKRLRLTGDLYRNAPVPENEMLYDEILVQAVKLFQQRHGLTIDGVLGTQTFAAMNVPVSKRIAQLKLTLERLRRLPERPARHYVRVNIPSYRLSAYQGDQKVMQMDVIVGLRSRKTPEFENVITTVGLNPTWTPPKSILRRDLLPKFRDDPDYIFRGGYQIKDRVTGRHLDPYTVDWHSASAHDIIVVQRPGRRNALGKVKFLLPNNRSIYLHDTAKPHLFNESMRALSSGCIRLSEPEKLIDFVIAAQPDERFTNIRKYYAGNANKHIRLDQPVLVQTTYFTAWVNEQGQVEFYDDIYNKDDRLQLALEQETRQIAAAQ